MLALPASERDTDMARIKIYKDALRCRTTAQHGAHEWYGNFTADARPAYHACPGIAWDLAGWLTLRGVQRDELDAMVREFADHTEDQMDALYDALHGSVA
jgi:hypothetical protein